jgi:FKBP-type peptidyl-prolyl cis-trans isomerase
MRFSFGAIILFIFIISCSKENEVKIDITKPKTIPSENYIITDSGLKFADIKLGSSQVAKAGNKVTVHYAGWLTTGKLFDTSFKRNAFNFQIGSGSVIPGWEEGVQGMRVGGIRQLEIPPNLAYGERGFPGAIPPNSILIFEIELLELK